MSCFLSPKDPVDPGPDPDSDELPDLVCDPSANQGSVWESADQW